MAARPATRRSAPRTADAPHRAFVRDLMRGGASYRIDWDVRPAYDFVFSLSGDAGATDDLPGPDRQWLATNRASLEPEVQAGIRELFESELAIHAGVLLVDEPDVRTAADFVQLVGDTSAADLIAALFADDGHDDELVALIERAVAGDTTVLP